jgi:hypothetical protein
MDFENVALTKKSSFICDRGHEFIIYIIYHGALGSFDYDFTLMGQNKIK